MAPSLKKDKNKSINKLRKEEKEGRKRKKKRRQEQGKEVVASCQNVGTPLSVL